jgi:hypothetical protein
METDKYVLAVVLVKNPLANSGGLSEIIEL